MLSEIGRRLRLTIFGTSHGPAVGCVLEGLPAGFTIDMESLRTFLNRRRPGASLTSRLQEQDMPRFTAGIDKQGVCDGKPLAAMIANRDARAGDYRMLKAKPRPGQADYPAYCKYGSRLDMAGGPFSGRLTAPLCLAGGIAVQLLAEDGIFVGSHLLRIGKVEDRPLPLYPTRQLLAGLSRKVIPVLDDEAGHRMQLAAELARQQGDSLGGIIQAAAIGLPVGLGGPLFAGLEPRLAAVLMAIPAAKGIEFGAGFGSARLRGSQNNDSFYRRYDGSIATASNNCGGILGGMSNGMPLTLQMAFKPTPCIALEQRTVDMASGKETPTQSKGRHDPCVVLRCCPIVEAAMALVLADMLMEARETICI